MECNIQSGNTLVFNSSVVNWTVQGFHSAHAVEVEANDWALMVFSGFANNANVYTLDNGFAASDSGTQYWVSYNIAPSVYQASGEATLSNDVLQVNVLNPLNAVVASTTVAPGAWNGTQTFQQKYFSYIGEGSGDVRLKITSGNPNSGRFAGAIYDIAFESAEPTAPIPEPSSFALIATGMLGAACVQHRRRARS